jgi:hypothetical protein
MHHAPLLPHTHTHTHTHSHIHSHTHSHTYTHTHTHTHTPPTHTHTHITHTHTYTHTQAYFINPIAVSGDRLGAWLSKTYASDWTVLVREREGFKVLQTSELEPKPQQAWGDASKAYKEMWGGMF